MLVNIAKFFKISDEELRLLAPVAGCGGTTSPSQPTQPPVQTQVEGSNLDIKISPPPNWQITDYFLGGQLATPLQDGNTSIYVTAVNKPNNDLSGFVDSDVNNLKNSATGTVDFVDRANTVLSGDFATVLHFIYKDSAFKPYVYEHEKTYLKHGDKIYIFDYAADTPESFLRYLDGVKKILNSVTFNSPSLSSEPVSEVPPCPGGMGGNSSHLDENTGQWVLDCSG